MIPVPLFVSGELARRLRMMVGLFAHSQYWLCYGAVALVRAKEEGRGGRGGRGGGEGGGGVRPMDGGRMEGEVVLRKGLYAIREYVCQCSTSLEYIMVAPLFPAFVIRY